MNFKYRKIEKITGQECFDTRSVWFEISDSQNNAIGEIRLTSKDFDFIMYAHTDHVGLSVKELEAIFKRAKSLLRENVSSKLNKMHLRLQPDA